MAENERKSCSNLVHQSPRKSGGSLRSRSIDNKMLTASAALSTTPITRRKTIEA
jgi:hypothetical protein